MLQKYDFLIAVAMLMLVIVSAMILLRAELLDDAEAQSRQADVVMLSFPMRQGVYYRADEDYEEEQVLRQFFRRGYEIEAVIEPSEPDGTPIVIFKR